MKLSLKFDPKGPLDHYGLVLNNGFVDFLPDTQKCGLHMR